MGQSHRYSVRANPQAKGGAMVPLSFRVPKPVKDLLDERVAELVADESETAIENLSDALQDAAVKWLLIEGK